MVKSSDMVFYRYSPEYMSEDVLRKLFVVREKLFDSLFKELESAARNKTPRFYLIVGPRGIGKSHLLVLLYYEIQKKLKSLIIPVKLAEEEYSVFRASDLFLRVLEEQSEETSDILSLKQEDEIFHAALERLIQRSRMEGKGYIIFIENLLELFKQLDTAELHKVRSIFQRYDIFFVVASAPIIFPGISEYEEPFYNFFRVIDLREFSVDETAILIHRLAEVKGNKEFLENFEQYKERICALTRITGGSPRLLILFYELITKGELEDIEEALFKIIDEHTPFFQEVFQLLTPQRRIIFDSIISAGTPVTPKQIAEKARIDLTTVRTQLLRLEKDGYVISTPKGRPTYYEVRERLFRLWREMRQPFGRKRLSILMEFIQLWYTPEERKEIFKAKFELFKAGKETSPRELCYYADTVPLEFETAILDIERAYIEKHIEHRKFEGDVYYKELKKIVVQTIDRKWNKIPLYGKQLMFSEKRWEDALKIFDKALESNPKDRSVLSWKGLALTSLDRHEEALDAFNEVLRLNPKDESALSNKGAVLVMLDKYEEALENFDKALEINPKGAFALSRKGLALLHLNRDEDAMKVFNEVLEVNPKDEFVLSNKGATLGMLGRYEEALENFDKALEINPKDENTLRNKGVVLFYLERYTEALDAANRAKEVATSDSSKIDAALIQIASNMARGRKSDAIREIESIKDRISEQEPYLIGNFIGICLNLALDELKAKNPGNAFRLMNKAFENASVLMKKTSVTGTNLEKNNIATVIKTFLKGVVGSGEIPFIKVAVDDAIKLHGERYQKLLKPLIKAIEIIETRDTQRYYRLQIEERELVADIVRTITKSDELLPLEIIMRESR